MNQKTIENHVSDINPHPQYVNRKSTNLIIKSSTNYVKLGTFKARGTVRNAFMQLPIDITYMYGTNLVVKCDVIIKITTSSVNAYVQIDERINTTITSDNFQFIVTHNEIGIDFSIDLYFKNNIDNNFFMFTTGQTKSFGMDFVQDVILTEITTLPTSVESVSVNNFSLFESIGFNMQTGFTNIDLKCLKNRKTLECWISGAFTASAVGTLTYSTTRPLNQLVIPVSIFFENNYYAGFILITTSNAFNLKFPSGFPTDKLSSSNTATVYVNAYYIQGK